MTPLNVLHDRFQNFTHGLRMKAARNSCCAIGLNEVFCMKIRVGFEMIYDFPQPTPLIAVVGTHFSRASDILEPDYLTISPSVPITPYRDGLGNWCSRIVAPAGRVRLAADGVGQDRGLQCWS